MMTALAATSTVSRVHVPQHRYTHREGERYRQTCRPRERERDVWSTLGLRGPLHGLQERKEGDTHLDLAGVEGDDDGPGRDIHAVSRVHVPQYRHHHVRLLVIGVAEPLARLLLGKRQCKMNVCMVHGECSVSSGPLCATPRLDAWQFRQRPSALLDSEMTN